MHYQVYFSPLGSDKVKNTGDKSRYILHLNLPCRCFLELPHSGHLSDYSRLSLSRTRLSRITAYLEVIIWSLF